MRAAIALALLAASAAPVSAGFRYVPPEQGVGQAEESAPVPADKKSDEAKPDIGPAPGLGPSVWRVRAGETLRETLARWGARAGTEVLFLTDRRYRLEGAASFEGPFGEAAQNLLGALAHLPHPPEGVLSEDGRSFVVIHRLPAATAGGKP